MASPPNTTNITPPRVPFFDPVSGLISREWYRFLLNLFTVTGSGTGVTPVVNGGTGVATIPANGELLIGNGSGYTVHTLNNGQNITVTNGVGTIEIALSGIVQIANGGTATSDVPGIGELLIGDGTSYQVQNLTSGQNILITNGAGSITIALTGIVPIANGGTNATTTPTAGAVSYGTGTAYGFTAVGTVGQVLTSAGAGTPTWATPTTGTVSSVDVSGGTTGLTTSGGPITSSGTITLAGTLIAVNGGTGYSTYTIGDILYASSTTALSKLADVATGNSLISGGVGVAPSWGKIGLTTHVSGTLAAGNGGTGFATYVVGDILYASTTSALSQLADVATGNALISGGVGVAPSWGKVGLTTHVSGTLPIANGGTNGTATPTAGAVPYGTGTAFGFTAAGTSGQVLTSAGAGTPTWTTPTTGTVTSVGQTFTGGLISVTGSPVTGSGTLALTVAGTSGGIPYFSSASAWASSAALTANALVIGGGAGVAPATTTTGTGVVTALGVNTGTAGAFVVNGGALGTPAGGTVTNLTGTASININGTVGATTPTTGVFTTLIANTSAGIGAIAPAGINFNNAKNITGTTTAYANYTNVNIQSDVTVSGRGYTSIIGTAASAFSTVIQHFLAGQGTIGAGSTVTTQVGFYGTSGLIGATTNYAFLADNTAAITAGKTAYGFYSGVNTASGGGTAFGVYAAGTANNYFGGNVGISRIPTTNLDVNGSIAFRAPSLTNAATYTVATTDVSLRFTTTACTVTLPAAASFTGRVLYLNNVTAIAVTSASSNVIPLGSNTAGTAILAATAGKFAMIQSDGTNWITMMAN